MLLHDGRHSGAQLVELPSSVEERAKCNRARSVGNLCESGSRIVRDGLLAHACAITNEDRQNMYELRIIKDKLTPLHSRYMAPASHCYMASASPRHKAALPANWAFATVAGCSAAARS